MVGGQPPPESANRLRSEMLAAQRVASTTVGPLCDLGRLVFASRRNAVALPGASFTSSPLSVSTVVETPPTAKSPRNTAHETTTPSGVTCLPVFVIVPSTHV